MRISQSARAFSIEGPVSQCDLEGLLVKCRESIVLGRQSHNPREYYAVCWPVAWGRIEQNGIGIRSEGHGLRPELLLLGPASEEALVGFNSEVALVDLRSASLVAERALPCLFHGFVHLAPRNLVLAVHEMGISALDDVRADVRWEYSRDVVTDLRVDPGAVTLRFMDENEVTLDLNDGRECLDRK